MPRPPANSTVLFWRHTSLPGLELRASSFRQTAFREHLHSVYSIGLIDHGSTVSTLRGRSYCARSGQIVLIEPYAVHACNPDPNDGLAYRMFFASGAWLGADLASPWTFPDTVIDDAALFTDLDALFSGLIESSAPTRWADRVRSTLARLTRVHAIRSSDRLETNVAGAIATLCADMQRHPTESISVADLAARVGMSRAHFARSFRRATGLTPHAYTNLLRVEHAKRLLADGAPLAQTAAESGFADQSHFARTFRRFSGATPAQYRAASSAAR